MLSGTQYYHRTVRKLVVAFGNIFNNVKLVRYNIDNTVEIERINVPLAYASKEKFYKRITRDPDLVNPVNLTIPRMAFDMTAITYDATRKISTFIDNYALDGDTGLNTVKATPYNFDFNLYAFVRNTEDGMQIIEQILPYFNPDYTVTIDYLPLDGFKWDVPIVFNSISYEDTNTGDPESTRSIIWNLNFTVKGYLFSPIKDSKIIRKATANVYNNYIQTQENGLFFTSGQGNFSRGELVYQGSSLSESSATAYVSKWDSSSNNLVLYDVTGTFRANSTITGFVSGAKYTISTQSDDPTQLVNITVLPNPPTANADDDYGFTTTIEEFPNIT